MSRGRGGGRRARERPGVALEGRRILGKDGGKNLNVERQIGEDEEERRSKVRMEERLDGKTKERIGV